MQLPCLMSSCDAFIKCLDTIEYLVPIPLRKAVSRWPFAKAFCCGLLTLAISNGLSPLIMWIAMFFYNFFVQGSVLGYISYLYSCSVSFRMLFWNDTDKSADDSMIIIAGRQTISEDCPEPDWSRRCVLPDASRNTGSPSPLPTSEYFFKTL